MRALIPAHFPCLQHVIEPEQLPADAKRIGEEVTEQDHCSAAVFRVDRYVRPKCAVEDRILIAPMPSLLSPKSDLGASLAAQICVSKLRTCMMTATCSTIRLTAAIENTIRPMAIGRKNYLFAGSDGGARHAAFLYSLLGTCKLHNVETFAYLCDVIARIGDHKHKEIHERLPQNWQPLTTWRSSKRWLAIGTRSSGTCSELIELTAF